MATKRKKQAVNRRQSGQFLPGNQEGKKFEPGQSGNSSGRPRRTKIGEALMAKLAEAFPAGSETTIADHLAASLIKEALQGNVMAIREIADRTEGRPRQALDIDMNGMDWRDQARQLGLSIDDVIAETKRLIDAANREGDDESD